MKGETTDTETAQPNSEHKSRSDRLTSHVVHPASYGSRFTVHGLRHFLIAWQFLTAVPLSRVHHEPAPHDLARSLRWYPVVGLVLGGLLVLGESVFHSLLAISTVSALLVAQVVLMTRGLHQDGFADTLDGLAGGRTPAERLAIMRDGRIGAIGATGLVVILLLRYTGLTALLGAEAWQAGGWMVLLCMPIIGRSAMVLGTVVAPYARPEGGLGAPFLSSVSWQDVTWATVLAGGILLGFLGPVGFVVGMALAVGVAWAVGLMARRLLGGITGDTLGAVNELAETLFLLAGPFLLTWQ